MNVFWHAGVQQKLMKVSCVNDLPGGGKVVHQHTPVSRAVFIANAVGAVEVITATAAPLTEVGAKTVATPPPMEAMAPLALIAVVVVPAATAARPPVAKKQTPATSSAYSS
jgi:hypothetical protein